MSYRQDLAVASTWLQRHVDRDQALTQQEALAHWQELKDRVNAERTDAGRTAAIAEWKYNLGTRISHRLLNRPLEEAA